MDSRPLDEPDGTEATPGRPPRELMLSGDLYIPDEQLAEDHRRAMQLLEGYNRNLAALEEERRNVLRELLGSFGEGSEIRPPFYCDYGYQIRVGERTFANFGLVALDVATITIGDDVQIGSNVQLLTPTHPLEAELRRSKWEAAEPITIGDNVWLGSGALVLPGVTIGENSVVGAGAVVTKDVPAGVLVVGNPAQVARSL